MALLLGALDIGTQTTSLIAGEYEDGRLTILHCTSTETVGVKKGIIRDIDAVVRGVRKVYQEMQKNHKIDLNDVIVNFSSAAINTLARPGYKSLLPGHAIDENDVYEAEQNAFSDAAPDAMDVLVHRFRQKYEVNGQPVNTPLGMTGSKLTANILELTAPKSSIDALNSVIHKAGIRQSDVVFSAAADAEAVLDRRSRDEGSLVINFGAGTSDYMMLCNGTVAAAGAISVGGSHLTNDLALAFQLSQAQAEEVKLAKGAAMIQPDLSSERYSLHSAFATTERTISVHAIQTVTTERVNETLRLLHDLLEEKGFLSLLHGRLYLTGGTAALPLITEQASAIFGLPCTLGIPLNVSGMPEQMQKEPARFATAIGLLCWRVRNLSAEERRPSLFSRIRNFLRG
ncbi:MAG: cell division protein FtsA [Kiritimatiellia bacterium]